MGRQAEQREETKTGYKVVVVKFYGNRSPRSLKH
jgi:hypothetical protein